MSLNSCATRGCSETCWGKCLHIFINIVLPLEALVCICYYSHSIAFALINNCVCIFSYKNSEKAALPSDLQVR